MSIISVYDRDPLKDRRQSQMAMNIRRGLQRMFARSNIATLPELTLANGRRADLVALDAKGYIFIVEIKSSIEDYHADSKWPEYKDYCDDFYFATHCKVPANIFPDTEGFILADKYDAEIIRTSERKQMPAAKRKAMIQRFAICAADRLLNAELAAARP